jgi:perosamine synthetase
MRDPGFGHAESKDGPSGAGYPPGARIRSPRRNLRIVGLGKRHGLEVIEDAAESLGSFVLGPNGEARPTGTFGAASCFSFNGNKIITTGGGGMLVTSSPDIAHRAKYLSTQAKDDEVFFVHDEIGYNYRLTSLQAALGIAQLEALERVIARKREIHDRYVSNFRSAEPSLRLIPEPSGTRANYWMNTLQFIEGAPVDLRRLVDGLSAEDGIQTRPLWKLNHLQKPYARNEAYRIVVAPKLYERTLSIPSTSNLSNDEIDRVSEALVRRIRKERK